MIPRISLVAYADQNFVFVMVPNERGRYLRTHPCVVYTHCPHCGALMGEPCFRAEAITGRPRTYTAATHWKRRDRALKPINHDSIKPRRWPEDERFEERRSAFERLKAVCEDCVEGECTMNCGPSAAVDYEELAERKGV